jgi:hypothetical protein
VPTAATISARPNQRSNTRDGKVGSSPALKIVSNRAHLR